IPTLIFDRLLRGIGSAFLRESCGFGESPLLARHLPTPEKRVTSLEPIAEEVVKFITTKGTGISKQMIRGNRPQFHPMVRPGPDEVKTIPISMKNNKTPENPQKPPLGILCQ
ncbi:MAG: hypothetical protein ACFFCO_12460, partial [Promethearchaeota archaeon]